MTPPSVRSALAALACLLACATPGRPQDAPPPVLSTDGYIARLDALSSAIGAADDHPSPEIMALFDELPRSWRLSGTQEVFTAPTDALRRDLRAWVGARDRMARRRALDHLHTLRSEAALFERPAPDGAASRALLTDILARREFGAVHGPTWLDRLRQRIFAFVWNLIGRFLEPSVIPALGTVIVYGLMALAALALVMWAYRMIQRAPTLRAAALPPRQSVPAKAWPAWLAEANEAAARGQWREAIHFSYWCAVSFLEARGMWRPDRARTPREYVRLLPAASEEAVTLGALTGRFERVWYGTDGADAQAFAESIANLKKMGCPAA